MKFYASCTYDIKLKETKEHLMEDPLGHFGWDSKYPIGLIGKQ